MSCFSLAWLQQVLVWLVIVGAVVAILRLLIPWVLGVVGIPVVGQAVNIILWAVVIIYVIYIVFALLGCLAGGGGLSFPAMPHR